jgi:signal transduction histidine kinase
VSPALVSSWASVAIVGALLCKAAALPDATWLSVLLILLGARTLAGTGPRAPGAVRWLTACALLAELLFVGWRLRPAAPPDTDRSARIAVVQKRARQIAEGLGRCAASVATMPDARQALNGGGREALDRLFSSLQANRICDPGRPPLAVHGARMDLVAWAGRVGDLVRPQASAKRAQLLVVNGSLATRFVAVAPIEDARGQLLGFASAERTVAVRRHIQNDFLSDFDLLASAAPAVEVRYLGNGDEGDTPHLAPGEALVSAADGRAIAAVRAAPYDRRPADEPPLDIYRTAEALVGGALFVFLALASIRGSAWEAALELLAARVALLLLPTDAAWSLRLLTPAVYTAPGLGRFAATPLHLLLTSLVCFGLSLLLVGRVAPRSPGRLYGPRALAADLLALPLLGCIFAALGDTVARCALDVQIISLWPPSPADAVLHWSVLLVMATGAAILVALFTWGGPLPATWPARAFRLGIWVVIGLAANAVWPRQWVGLPLVPAIGLYLTAAILGGTRGRWGPRLRRATPGEIAGLGLACVSGLTVLLYPTLVHFAEKDIRSQIEGDYSAAVLRQPAWRKHVLAAARSQIDAMDVLETPPLVGGSTPLVDELAFAVWSRTDLAAFGFSSAVEIQDASGALLSRFALNLPAISSPLKSLPATESWTVSEDMSSLASVERRVLHARRLLVYHGEVHGAVHVYVATDYWNLPFLSGRDPYSVLYRTGPRGPAQERSVELFAMTWEREVVFNSAERPPVLDASLLSRARHGPFWTTVPQEDGAQHTFLFSDQDHVYGIGYPRKDARQFAAELVEALTGMTFSGAALLLLVLVLRGAMRRPSLSLTSFTARVRERFSLRLFVAFIAVAVLPVVVLELVVRNFVSERLRREAENEALERAATARKIVEDYALFQRSEAPGQQLVTDSALVWVASAIRNDLDVFLHGHLQASSKRELYASGLLAARVPGRTYRAIVLEGRPSVVGAERIGSFSYMVASVPVRLGAGETGILAIPLALRQRETQNALAELDRAIRLASILFLFAAGGLAHSMARRISGPVRGLTDAAQRIARGNLDARVATTSQDEFLTLVEAFNQMAGDLERQRIDLERSNRRAAWADMARQVAHEVKNPLTPIQLSTEHLRRLHADGSADFDAALESCTETILDQVRKLREIVTEFSAFARPPGASAEAVDIRDLVEAAIAPYTGALPPGVRLSLDAPRDLPAVRGDRRLLERAVLNLLENALQAVGEGGSVAIRLRRNDPEPGSVAIEVEDSAGGLDPEVLARAFEPFFSTKTGGSGLGLALVRKIAEDHGGGATLEGGRRSTRARMWLRGQQAPPVEQASEDTA